MTKYKVQPLWVNQKWFISYEFVLSGRVYMAKYTIRRIIFAQNGKNSLKNINDSLKTTWNKSHAIKFMMTASNVTIWFRPFHNTTITLCLKSITSPLTSKIMSNTQYLKNGDIPSGIFWWNFILDMREYKGDDITCLEWPLSCFLVALPTGGWTLTTSSYCQNIATLVLFTHLARRRTDY